MSQAQHSFVTISATKATLTGHQGGRQWLWKDHVGGAKTCKAGRQETEKNVSKSTTAKNKSPLKKCELVQKINKHHPLFPFHSSISVPFTFPKWAMSVVSHCCEILYLMGHTGKNTFVTLYLMGMWQFSRNGGVGWCQLWVRMCEAGPWVIFFRWPFINVNKFSFNTFLWKRDMQKRHEQSVNRLYGFAKLELKVIGKSSKSKGHPKKSHSSKKALAITKRMRF